jgi:hypothetical protein
MIHELSFSRLWNGYETDQEARSARDKQLREYRKQGIRCRGWRLTNQLRKYAGFGQPDGRSCTVYKITVLDVETGWGGTKTESDRQQYAGEVCDALNGIDAAGLAEWLVAYDGDCPDEVAWDVEHLTAAIRSYLANLDHSKGDIV